MWPQLALGAWSYFQQLMAVKERAHKKVSPDSSWRTAAGGGNTPSLVTLMYSIRFAYHVKEHIKRKCLETGCHAVG